MISIHYGHIHATLNRVDAATFLRMFHREGFASRLCLGLYQLRGFGFLRVIKGV